MFSKYLTSSFCHCKLSFCEVLVMRLSSDIMPQCLNEMTGMSSEEMSGGLLRKGERRGVGGCSEHEGFGVAGTHRELSFSSAGKFGIGKVLACIEK